MIVDEGWGLWGVVCWVGFAGFVLWERRGEDLVKGGGKGGIGWRCR